MRTTSSSVRIALLLTATTVPVAGCEDRPPADVPEAAADVAVDSTPSSPSGRRFERSVVFLSTRGDSTLLVPWLLSARTRPGGVDRRARAWLARGGAWEGFLDETWESPPSRAPWRIVPHGPMRLLVGEGDALERLVFSEGPRQLELVLQDPLAEWSAPRGETFRLVEGGLVLAEERLDGLILDLSRARPAAAGAGEGWALLTSGDSLQMVLQIGNDQVQGAARGWARLDFRNLQWPSLDLEWSETRAFERARRDVPVAWTLTSSGGELSGELEVRSAKIEAGEGEGPQLPVDALFEVAGTLTVEGGAYPVRGLLRHLQP